MHLDTTARPGINLGGNGSLKVNGTLLANSNVGGLNQYGQAVNNGNAENAVTTVGHGVRYVKGFEPVRGGDHDDRQRDPLRLARDAVQHRQRLQREYRAPRFGRWIKLPTGFRQCDLWGRLDHRQRLAQSDTVYELIQPVRRPGPLPAKT